MNDQKDFSDFTLEELIVKQKSLADRQKIAVVVICVLVGMTLYSVFIKSHDMHPFLLLGSLFFMFYNSSKLKKVELEIEKRKN
jgi:hypothetical protein